MGILALRVTLKDGSEELVAADARVDTKDDDGNRIIRLMKDGQIIKVFQAGDVQEPIRALTHDR